MRGNRVWAEIDLSAVRNNVAALQAELGAETKLLAVVKADAYGHGAVPFSWSAVEAGAAMLGVGDSGEAIELRESGLTAPILILGAIFEEEIQRVVEYDISVTVHSADLLPLLNEEARRANRLLRVHLKVDTGMGRLGATPPHAADLARRILGYRNLKLEGLSTHFAGATSGPPEAAREQLEQFQWVVRALAAVGIRPPLLHAANSAAAMRFPEARFDMVRSGVALYGIDTGTFRRRGLFLRPVLSLKSRIVYLKHVPEGTPIGYDGRYSTSTATRIATCPVGYNDGYPHRLSNRAEVLLHGRRVRVVGTVTMDYLMLDVDLVPDAAVGDVVTLIGEDGGDRVGVEEIARTLGTIPHEITCGLGKRVKRVYGASAPAIPHPAALPQRGVA